MSYEIKDSGKHNLYKSGMNRDNRDNKIKYSLIYPQNSSNELHQKDPSLP